MLILMFKLMSMVSISNYKHVSIWTYEYINVWYINIWTYGLQRHKMHHIKYLLAVLRPYDERYKQNTYIVS